MRFAISCFALTALVMGNAEVGPAASAFFIMPEPQAGQTSDSASEAGQTEQDTNHEIVTGSEAAGEPGGEPAEGGLSGHSSSVQEAKEAEGTGGSGPAVGGFGSPWNAGQPLEPGRADQGFGQSAKNTIGRNEKDVNGPEGRKPQKDTVLEAILEWVPTLIGLGVLFVLIWAVRRLVTQATTDDDPAVTDQEMLTAISELHREGELTGDEFRSIKGQLVRRIRENSDPDSADADSVSEDDSSADAQDNSSNDPPQGEVN